MHYYNSEYKYIYFLGTVAMMPEGEGINKYVLHYSVDHAYFADLSNTI